MSNTVPETALIYLYVLSRKNSNALSFPCRKVFINFLSLLASPVVNLLLLILCFYFQANNKKDSPTSQGLLRSSSVPPLMTMQLSSSVHSLSRQSSPRRQSSQSTGIGLSPSLVANLVEFQSFRSSLAKVPRNTSLGYLKIFLLVLL